MCNKNSCIFYILDSLHLPLLSENSEKLSVIPQSDDDDSEMIPASPENQR